MSVHCMPCPAGNHTYDEYGNSCCPMPTTDLPCNAFTSLGYGPEGDYEHSLFCRTCGWEYGDHVPCLYCDSREVTEHSDEDFYCAEHLPACEWTDAGECLISRERSAAGISNDVPACPVHGPAVECGLCGMLFAPHADESVCDECATDPALDFDTAESRGFDGTLRGMGPDCQYRHTAAGLPHRESCRANVGDPIRRMLGGNVNLRWD
jgi:hypothetical protein